VTKVLFERREITDLKDMLNQSAKIYGDKDAFKLKDKNGNYYGISYKKFKKDVDALGTAMYSKGLKGAHIAVIGENRYEWCTTYLAVANGVGVIVPLDKELPEKEIENLIKRSKAKAVVFSKKYEPIMKKIQEDNKDLKVLINMDAKKSENGIESFSKMIEEGRDLIKGGKKDYINAKIDPDKMSMLLFTSGTTDLAKGVMLCHKNLAKDIFNVTSVVYLNETDTALSILPIHHTYECTAGFLTMLYVGGTIAFCEGLKHIVKNLQEVKPTIVMMVPLILDNMHKKIWESLKKKGLDGKIKVIMKVTDFLRKYLKIDLRKKVYGEILNTFGGQLRLAIAGGAAARPDVMKDLNSFGIHAMQGYGLTETSPIVAVNQEKVYNDASAGIPLPNIEVEVYNPNEEGIGEIRVKGDIVMLGYYENKEATDAVIRDGWFYTGDLGYMDKKNFVYITGRQKNVIVTKNGKNIFPEEVEYYLDSSEFIKESMVYGKESDKDEDLIITAIIVPEYEAIAKYLGKENPSDKEVRDLIDLEVRKANKNMLMYKMVRDFEIRKEELTKTTTKKIKRNANI